MLQRTTNFYRARFLRLRFALVLAELVGFDATRLLALADCGDVGRGELLFSTSASATDLPGTAGTGERGVSRLSLGATRPAAAPETAICVAAKSISPVLNARP